MPWFRKKTTWNEYEKFNSNEEQPIRFEFWKRLDRRSQTVMADDTNLSQSRISRLNAENIKVWEFLELCRAMNIENPSNLINERFPEF